MDAVVEPTTWLSVSAGMWSVCGYVIKLHVSDGGM